MDNKLLAIGFLSLLLIVSGCVQPPSTTSPGTTPPTPPATNEVPSIYLSYGTSSSATEGQPVSFGWDIGADTGGVLQGAGFGATHTAVHFDTVSHSGSWGTDVTPAQSGYADFTKEYASGNYAFPATFNGTAIAPAGGSGLLYFRAHAIIDGKNYWTPEQSIPLLKVYNAATGNGTIAVTIKDALVDFNTVQSLSVTISDIQLHSAGMDDNSGWITLNTSPKTIDLLTVRTVDALFAQAAIPSGEYTQIRFGISGAKATIAGVGNVDVRVPSGKMKIVQTVKVDSNQLSVLTLDFAADQSLLSTGNGYSLKPVIHATSYRNATLENIGPSQVRLRNGTEFSSQTIAFDLDGKETQPPASTPPTAPPGAPTKTFKIELDDAGIYPNSITVKKGDVVEVDFMSRAQGTYYGGLDVRDGVWGANVFVATGKTKSVTFTADQSFSFKTYWPSSGVYKATGQVVVEP